MKMRLVAGITAAALCGAPAFAADVPINASPQTRVPGWSGSYFGLHAGYGWTDVGIIHDIGVAPIISDSVSANGALYGAHLGLNAQYGNLVVGGELSLSKANIKGSQANCAPVLFGPNVDTCKANVDWLALAMARLGYAPSDFWMIYGTAGLAVAGLTTNDNLVGASSNLFRVSGVHAGFAFGGGVEYRFAGTGTTLGLEYLRVQLDESTHNPSLLFPKHVSSDINIVRARLSIKN